MFFSFDRASSGLPRGRSRGLREGPRREEESGRRLFSFECLKAALLADTMDETAAAEEIHEEFFCDVDVRRGLTNYFLYTA